MGRGPVSTRRDCVVGRPTGGCRHGPPRPRRFDRRLCGTRPDRRRTNPPRSHHGDRHAWPRNHAGASYLLAARSAGRPAECRARNSRRDRPVPASAVDGQLRTMRTVQAGIADEGWDVVQHFGADAYTESPYATGTLAASRLQHESPSELEFILQVSQFRWGDDPAGWLISIVTAAERADSPASPSWTTSSRSRRSARRGIRFPSRW